MKDQGKYVDAISLIEFRLEKGYKHIEYAEDFIKELQKTSKSC